MSKRNVFVLGLDDLNREVLERCPAAPHIRFHRLLTHAELQESADIALPDLLAKAERQLEAFDGSVHAVVGYWDFPVSSMVPLLCRRFGLRSAPLEAVLRCEDKYWSRLEQAKVIDEYPAFGVVDPHAPDARPPEHVGYPFWLKPVKSFASALAFHVEDAADFHRALEAIRDKIDYFGEPFDYVLSHARIPDEIAEVGGGVCIAEEAATGAQVTVEGFAVGGDVHVYGAFDSINYPDVPTFLRFQYPSRLPEEVTGHMADISRRVISAIGLEPSTFNIEYFWDADRQRLTLLEINPRHSQSHARLLEAVDGVANHEAMVDLALDRPPRMRRRSGAYAVAAKWFLKRFDDGLVKREPTAEEIARIEAEVPGTRIHLTAHEGDRLSQLPVQDSYSYQLAHVYIAGDSDEDLVAKYERCVEALPFEFDD